MVLREVSPRDAAGGRSLGRPSQGSKLALLGDPGARAGCGGADLEAGCCVPPACRQPSLDLNGNFRSFTLAFGVNESERGRDLE